MAEHHRESDAVPPVTPYRPESGARCQICGAPHDPDGPILCATCGEPVLRWGWAP
jgi:hypothetical protein